MSGIQLVLCYIAFRIIEQIVFVSIEEKLERSKLLKNNFDDINKESK